MSACRYCEKPLGRGRGRPRVICTGRRCRKLYLRDYAAEKRAQVATNLRAVVSKSRAGHLVTEALECGHVVVVPLSRSRLGGGRRRCGECALALGLAGKEVVL